MSRSIEAVNGEPGAVNIARARSSGTARGAKPCAAAMAAHLVEQRRASVGGAGRHDVADRRRASGR